MELLAAYAVEALLRMVEVPETPTLADDPNADTVFDIEPVLGAGGCRKVDCQAARRPES